MGADDRCEVRVSIGFTSALLVNGLAFPDSNFERNT
jgi:hypothetical protein